MKGRINTAKRIGRQEKESAMTRSAAPDDETFHVQADGFYGPEKGFEDVEQLRRQHEQQN